jgi:hypothetical protein
MPSLHDTKSMKYDYVSKPILLIRLWSLLGPKRAQRADEDERVLKIHILFW